jgi:hypothetical protein
MGKYDHIPELLGSENYVGWSTKMQYALVCEDLWCHINTVVDPADLLGTPSVKPVPVDLANIMAAETTAIREWLLNNMKAKDLITHRLSPSVRSLVSHSHTISARKVWQMLAEHFNQTDTSAQYQLRQRLDTLWMKDSADAMNYVGQHAVLCERLHDSGAPLRDRDAIYSILIGLPQMPIWQQFKSMLEQRMHDEIMTAMATRPSTFTIDSCVSRITAEAARHVHAQAVHLARPGSEYANAASSSNMNTPNVNSITGLRKHRHNPDGVFCTTPRCNKGDHDHAHCYQKGGGMEGQAPWMRNKKQKDEPKNTANVAAATTTTTPPAPAPVIAAVLADLSSLMQDLSFASITEIPDEIACATKLLFMTILDLGTTVTIVKDRWFFHTYSTENPVDVLTANHGILQTTGCGTCVAWFMIGGCRLRIRLSNCLHAPNALLNLLSVSCMNAKGWDINFRANMTCELSYKGASLGRIPATGKLYAPDIEFVPFLNTPCTMPGPEISAFVNVPMTLDLWHARIGHISQEAVMQLSRVAKGVTIQSSSPLSHCESCILAKHPRQPYHLSETDRVKSFLDLIHSDVCGPIPTVTPHAKRYFIIFLDDHTHVLDLQLLASKDQALLAWRTVRAWWENMSGKCVKIFRSDNGGEFLSDAFSANLEETGVLCQRSAPYAHQQNGKAERVIRTIEGRMYAMLDFTCLPPSLWGEAALTACYLFNRTESCALPTGKTPYEMLHMVQPNLSHLRVFGACCFTRIPPELQEKLGPCSQEAIFMGYPPGVKVWWCRDIATGAFFNSCDIIFDETLANCPFPDSDDKDEGTTSSSASPPAAPAAPTAPAHSTAAPPHVEVICCLGQIPVPTAKGQLFKSQIAHDKA